MRAHNNERLATESEQEFYHAFWGPRPVAWVQRIQHSDANWECTKSVNNLNRLKTKSLLRLYNRK